MITIVALIIFKVISPEFTHFIRFRAVSIGAIIADSKQPIDKIKRDKKIQSILLYILATLAPWAPKK